jgi:hypothetical protein
MQSFEDRDVVCDHCRFSTKHFARTFTVDPSKSLRFFQICTAAVRVEAVDGGSTNESIPIVLAQTPVNSFACYMAYGRLQDRSRNNIVMTRTRVAIDVSTRVVQTWECDLSSCFGSGLESGGHEGKRIQIGYREASRMRSRSSATGVATT